MINPYKPGDFSRVVEAVVILRQAREFLAVAGATRAAKRVGGALKSAEAARWHVEHRQRRAARAPKVDRRDPMARDAEGRELRKGDRVLDSDGDRWELVEIDRDTIYLINEAEDRGTRVLASSVRAAGYGRGATGGGP